MNKRTNNKLEFTMVMPTMRKSLLALAVASTMVLNSANAAAVAVAGTTVGAPTDLIAATAITTSADARFGALGVSTADIALTNGSGEATGTWDIDHNTTLNVFDHNSTAAHLLTVDDDVNSGGSVNIASAKTLTLTVGSDGAGGNTNAVNLTFDGAIIGADADSVLNITTNSSAASTITFKGVSDLSTGTISLNHASDTVVIANTAAMTTGGIDNGTGGDGVGILTVNDQGGGAITAVSGAVGATNSLAAVNVTSTSGDVTFGGNVDATTITLTGAGDSDQTVFSGNVTGAVVITTAGLVTMAADKIITGAVTTSADNEGILTFNAATATATLASSTIGASGTDLKTVNITVTEDGGNADATGTITGAVFANTVNATSTADDGSNTDTIAFSGAVTATTLNSLGAGTITAGGDVTAAVVFGTDTSSTGTISVAANKKIVGAVTTATAQTIGQTTEGILTFAAATTDTILANSTIGVSANALKTLNLTVTDASADDSTVTGTVTGAVFATTVNATATAAVAASDGDTVAFSGAVTATTFNSLGAGTITAGGDVTAAVVFGANTSTTGTISVAADKKIVGAVTTATAQTVSGSTEGVLTFAATTATTILASATVGTSANALKTVNITSTETGANATIKASVGGNLFATTVNATSTAYQSNGTTVADEIEFGGTVTATTVNLLGAGLTDFTDDVTAAVVFGANTSTTGTVTVAADKKIVGAVSAVDTGEGTLTFADITTNTTIASSTIGASGKLLKAVNAGAATGTTATVTGIVYASDVFVNGVGTVAFSADVNAGCRPEDCWSGNYG